MRDVREAMRRAGLRRRRLRSSCWPPTRRRSPSAWSPLNAAAGLPVQPRGRRVGPHGAVPGAVGRAARGRRPHRRARSWTWCGPPRAARRAATTDPAQEWQRRITVDPRGARLRRARRGRLPPRAGVVPPDGGGARRDRRLPRRVRALRSGPASAGGLRDGRRPRSTRLGGPPTLPTPAACPDGRRPLSAPGHRRPRARRQASSSTTRSRGRLLSRSTPSAVTTTMSSIRAPHSPSR